MERLFEKEEGTIAHFECSSVNWSPLYIKRNKELIEQNEKMISLLEKNSNKEKAAGEQRSRSFFFYFLLLTQRITRMRIDPIPVMS